MKTRLVILGVVLATALRATPAQDAGAGQLQNVVVHGASLERNQVGLSSDRSVSVYLPPSYRRSSQRYPVVYVLHGIMDSNRTWTEAWDSAHPGFATMQDLMNQGIGVGTVQEMIVVVPDADKSCHYTDSPVKGGWGSFIAKDLVSFVDRTYRTIATAPGRGLMGHSMGGHGAIKIAMTHPGVFSAIYALNPSLLGWAGDVSAENPELGAVARINSLAELAGASFYAQAVVGIGQCFSPDPTAPLLTALPFATRTDGRLEPGPGHAQWAAQMPIYMLQKHAAALKSLRGIGFDSANTDEFSHIPPTARAFSAALDRAGVRHVFEMYDGDHRNRLWGRQGRINAVALPYFSRLLGDGVASAIGPARQTPASVGSDQASADTKAQVMLWDAAIAGDLKTAGEALKSGADVNALDTRTSVNGRRALNHAAERDRPEMIRWLVANGAQINGTNKTGFTPLHHAAEAGSLAAAEALVSLGANVKATLPSGSTPLDVARQRGKMAIVRLLEKGGGESESSALTRREGRQPDRLWTHGARE